jgi:hypothetical protein
MKSFSINPTILIIWAIVTLAFLLLIAYRSQITRYEEDQLFLTGGESHEQQEQNEIVRKVQRLAPYVRVLGGAASLVTFGIVGLWAYDAWLRLK